MSKAITNFVKLQLDDHKVTAEAPKRKIQCSRDEKVLSLSENEHRLMGF